MMTFIVAALTADGLIDTANGGRSFDWTSEEDKQFYIAAIKRARVVVVGSRSFASMKRFPKDMKYLVYTTRPGEFINPRPNLIDAKPTQLKPRELLTQLETEGYGEVAIAGGTSIYSMFLQAGVVDKIYLSIEPVMFGKGIRLVNERLNVKLHLDDVKKLGDKGTVILEYSVIK